MQLPAKRLNRKVGGAHVNDSHIYIIVLWLFFGKVLHNLTIGSQQAAALDETNEMAIGVGDGERACTRMLERIHYVGHGHIGAQDMCGLRHEFAHLVRAIEFAAEDDVADVVDVDNAEQRLVGRTDGKVGTHRLVSKDVQFRDLGLVVIDEEQRFGVAQKEKLTMRALDLEELNLREIAGKYTA